MKTKVKYLPFYGLSMFPLPVLYLLSDVLFLVSYHIIGYRRKVVYDNLRNSFVDKSELEIKEIEKKFYKHFCDIMVEAIKMLTIRKKEIQLRFRIVNPDLIEKCYSEKKHLVLYAAHQGNWEWLSFIKLFTPYKAVTLYQPLSNKYFDELIRIIRQRTGTICVESNSGYRTILEDIRGDQPSMYALIGDQSPGKTGAIYWQMFLNQKTAFFMGADRIIKKTNQTAIFPAYRKIKRGYYELEFKVLDTSGCGKDNFCLIDQYVKTLEEVITQSPEMWLWSHRRWKLSKTNELGVHHEDEKLQTA